MHTMSVLHTSLQGQPILSGRDDSQIRQGPARGARAPISRLVETRGSLESLKTERLQAAIDSALNCTFQGKDVLTSEFTIPNLNFSRLNKKKREKKGSKGSERKQKPGGKEKRRKPRCFRGPSFRAVSHKALPPGAAGGTEAAATAVAHDAETGAEGRLGHAAQGGVEKGLQRPSRGPQLLGALACQLRSQDFTGAKCRLRSSAWRLAHRPRHPFLLRRELRQLLEGLLPVARTVHPMEEPAVFMGILRTTAPAARGRALEGIGVRSGTSLKAGTSGPSLSKSRLRSSMGEGLPPRRRSRRFSSTQLWLGFLAPGSRGRLRGPTLHSTLRRRRRRKYKNPTEVPQPIVERCACLFARFKQNSRPLDIKGDFDAIMFAVPGQKVLCFRTKLTGPSFLEPANHRYTMTMSHGLPWTAAMGVGEYGEITPGDFTDGDFPSYGFSGRGVCNDSGFEGIKASISKVAARAKGRDVIFSMEGLLQENTPQVEGGMPALNAACRDAGSARSGDHLLLSPTCAVLRAVSVAWPI